MYRYNSTARKLFKRKWGLLPKYVQDHHVIPKQWRKHPCVTRYDYDINHSKNIIMMPTPLGLYKFDLRQERYTHDGGHYKYNMYVEEMLTSINGINCEKCFRKEYEYFLEFLKGTLRMGDDIIPWT